MNKFRLGISITVVIVLGLGAPHVYASLADIAPWNHLTTRFGGLEAQERPAFSEANGPATSQGGDAATPIRDPATLFLLGIGLSGLALRRRLFQS